jgi:ABC-type dipeptide/oligopeptide/nickel transport system permease subunit
MAAQQDLEVIETGLVYGAAAETTIRSRLRAIWVVWRRYPLGIIGAAIIMTVVAMSFLAPLVAPNDPRDFAGGVLESPSGSFLLGTNNLGQDVFSRALYGAQVSIAVGVSATFLGVFTGTLLGIVSGYFGGWADTIITRMAEIIASIPALVLVLAILSAIGRPTSTGSDVFTIAWQLKAVEVAIGIAFVFATLRVIRSAVFTQRELPYVEAAQSIGASSFRILWRHVLPNVLSLVIILFTSLIGVVILIEAAISFLGYGVAVGTPSWGIDLSGRNREFFIQAPWLIAGPGVALSLTVLGFNFLGDALRDILDPRLRGSR